MAGPERLVVDTSAMYALRTKTDRFHERANAAYERLTDEDRELWTTSYALVEMVALLHRRQGFEAVAEFSEWQDLGLRVLWIDSRLHDAAWAQFVAAQGRGLGLVDWTVAVASREMGAPVFTFDTGFVREGLSVTPR